MDGFAKTLLYVDIPKYYDSVLDESQAVHFPIEFLNSLEVSGFPSHLLSLKVSAPIIILRSLDPPKVTNGIINTQQDLYKLYGPLQQGLWSIC